MKECPCCKQVTDNFGVDKKLCRPCHLLKAKTRYLRFGYGSPRYNLYSPYKRHHRIKKEKRPISKMPKDGITYLKWKARKAVEHAVRYSKVERPGNCQICTQEAKTEAHHHDYLKPLEVIWICRKCHQKIHKNPSPIVEKATVAQ